MSSVDSSWYPYCRHYFQFLPKDLHTLFNSALKYIQKYSPSPPSPSHLCACLYFPLTIKLLHTPPILIFSLYISTIFWKRTCQNLPHFHYCFVLRTQSDCIHKEQLDYWLGKWLNFVRDRSISLIPTRHGAYSHAVPWAPRPYAERAQAQIRLVCMPNNGNIFMLIVSNSVLNYSAHIQIFYYRKIYELYILLFSIFSALILVLKVWYYPKSFVADNVDWTLRWAYHTYIINKIKVIKNITNIILL